MDRLFQGFTAESFLFFIMIRMNNNKEFFEQNRSTFEKCLKEPLYALAADMEEAMRAIDPAIDTRPQRAVARIRRSTRYTKDKSPYRDHLWIGWRDRSVDGQDGSIFGFYFEMDADSMGCGGGYYNAKPAKMTELRRKIELQPERFERAAKKAQAAGLTLCGQDYARVRAPEDLPALCRQYYTKKSFYLEKPLPIDETNASSRLPDILADVFTQMKELYAFINLN